MRQIWIFQYAYSQNERMYYLLYETKIFKVYSKWVGDLFGVPFFRVRVSIIAYNSITRQKQV